MAPATEIINGHVKTLMDYPLVQGGTSFDMSDMIGEVLKKGQQ